MSTSSIKYRFFSCLPLTAILTATMGASHERNSITTNCIIKEEQIQKHDIKLPNNSPPPMMGNRHHIYLHNQLNTEQQKALKEATKSGHFPDLHVKYWHFSSYGGYVLKCVPTVALYCIKKGEKIKEINLSGTPMNLMRDTFVWGKPSPYSISLALLRSQKDTLFVYTVIDKNKSLSLLVQGFIRRNFLSSYSIPPELVKLVLDFFEELITQKFTYAQSMVKLCCQYQNKFLVITGNSNNDKYYKIKEIDAIALQSKSVNLESQPGRHVCPYGLLGFQSIFYVGGPWLIRGTTDNVLYNWEKKEKYVFPCDSRITSIAPLLSVDSQKNDIYFFALTDHRMGVKIIGLRSDSDGNKIAVLPIKNLDNINNKNIEIAEGVSSNNVKLTLLYAYRDSLSSPVFHKITLDKQQLIKALIYKNLSPM